MENTGLSSSFSQAEKREIERQRWLVKGHLELKLDLEKLYEIYNQSCKTDTIPSQKEYNLVCYTNEISVGFVPAKIMQLTKNKILAMIDKLPQNLSEPAQNAPKDLE